VKRILVSILLAATLSAQDDKPKWNVNEPPGPTIDVNFETDEGTWMNLDVSPDGKDVVFDLLGDIYIMPIEGGEAKLLQGGRSLDVQPRFSPDGKKISFTSDRAGGDNIWIMDRDGSNPKQVTKETFRLLNNAVWTPDGQYLIARKHFTSARSAGAGEMWMYHVAGGEGLQMTKRKNDQQDAGEPNVSPDGRYLYWSEDMSPGPTFQYNKDPHGEIYKIRRLDRQTGKIDNLVTGQGGSIRPQISPDGKTIAFIRRIRLKTALCLMNLETGEQRVLFDGLNKDQQEAWAIFGVYPNFAWTPDGKSIVIWAGGKIHRVGVATGRTSVIPFRAKVGQKLTEALRFVQEPAPKEFDVKMVRNSVVSPDGKTLIFNAVGYLWKKSLPDGKPERLTRGTDFEMEAVFSPDGKTLVYTTWNDSTKGAIYKMKWGDPKSAVKISAEKGIFHEPSISADGQKLVYRKGGGNRYLGNTFNRNPGIYWMSMQGGAANFVTDEGQSPRFDPTGTRIYYMTDDGTSKAYKSVTLAGHDVRTHLTSKYATTIVPSPDFKWVAFQELFHGYVAPFPVTGKEYDLAGTSKAYPVYKFSKDVGDYLTWSADGRQLHWLVGPEFFTRDLKTSFTFVEGAPDSLPPVDTTGIKIGLTLPFDAPSGRVALTNARIITMKGDEVIEKGTVLLDGNRIIAVGADVQVPSGAKVIDCSGKTIMPGLIDVHAHPGHWTWSGTAPMQNWSYYANLAYGVTTMHDPSAYTEGVFTQSEMVKAGTLVGPRIFSTGMILYGAETDFKVVINNLDDAKSHLRRLKAVGAFSVKSYNQPRRDQRQQVIAAARELQMNVVPEGGSHFLHNMTMVMDGHTGVEHCLPVAPVYHDVVRLWKAGKTGYTPTLVVAYGGLSGEYYWYDKTDVWEKKRLLTFAPRSLVDARSIRRQKTPDKDYGHVGNAKVCKLFTDAGIRVNMGAHGQLDGLGAHWEMWMFAQGGMTPLEAIRASTINGAFYLGMEKDLGSIEAGKLADMIVLDKNPLENIQNTEFVHTVVVNGRVYDAETMNEIGTRERRRFQFYFANDIGGTMVGDERHGCICGAGE
jgi:imidazolonepropionase-like amidohydrolase/Tol biopolymer transport system component